MRVVLLSVFPLFTALPVIGTSQNTEAAIRSVKAKYQQVQQHANQYKKDTLDLPGQSTEGGVATVWHTGKEVKIINAVYYGESGKTEVNYYFDSSQIFFVLRKQYTYNVPFYITEKVAKRDKVEAFDDAKTKVQEERFYFNRNNIIRWMDGSKTVDTTTPESKSTIAELLKEAAALKQQFANPH